MANYEDDRKLVFSSMRGDRLHVLVFTFCVLKPIGLQLKKVLD